MTNITISIDAPVSSNPIGEMRRVRKWGEPIMVEAGFDVNQIGSSNFQAVKCWNDGNRTFGAVTNFLRIPNSEVLKIRDLQFDESPYDGKPRTKDAKMEWLCSYRGSIYMYELSTDDWKTAPYIRWGTLTLGGNLVQVVGYEDVFTSLNNEPRRMYRMAKLKGFRSSDWSKPLTQLLAEGLVHRCYSAYFPNNGFGDSPKGIVYSPFFAPLDYDFAGTEQPTAFYIPEIWLV